jgi:hypothetical protein
MVSGCSTVAVRLVARTDPGNLRRAPTLSSCSREEWNDDGIAAIACQTAEAFGDKIFRAALGTMKTFNLYLGDRLGWFDALAEGPATAAELAERTNTQPRYAIEWLEMMAVYGNLTVVDDVAGNRLQHRYALPPGAGGGADQTTQRGLTSDDSWRRQKLTTYPIEASALLGDPGSCQGADPVSRTRWQNWLPAAD